MVAAGVVVAPLLPGLRAPTPPPPARAPSPGSALRPGPAASKGAAPGAPARQRMTWQQCAVCGGAAAPVRHFIPCCVACASPGALLAHVLASSSREGGRLQCFHRLERTPDCMLYHRWAPERGQEAPGPAAEALGCACRRGPGGGRPGGGAAGRVGGAVRRGDPARLPAAGVLGGRAGGRAARHAPPRLPPPHPRYPAPQGTTSTRPPLHPRTLNPKP